MSLGKRIRLIRMEQKRTQEEIAKQCGFTKSLLSKIENDLSAPPVATLMKIAGALGVRVSDLIEEQSANATVFNSSLQYSDKDSWLRTDRGYSFYAFASERRDKLVQPYLITARKGEVKPHGFSHEGEEFIYMISGEMTYKVGATEYSLHPGDTLYFNSLEEHLLCPVSDEVTYMAIFTQKSLEQ
ncbi:MULTISPECIES: XRE family transcriptional regulator [unclassified Paenibacillus]|uniref:helix-turn-helix domain-containing protein n=1 Tax=unclassified Paenibacillus TaxID=185978 RepID=UPI0006FB4E5C|nr:XRE family transcriptional regulator [Paenibacillus sp. Leaf72]KQO04497.1 XRE family transcriptional regulator [Paenibacillus sp. Leaf72]